MTMDTEELKQNAQEIKERYLSGLLSRGEAKEQLKEYIEWYNTKAVELAEKYNQKPKKFNIGEFLRFRA